ncbi:DUF262 domain-containing protein [Yersinia hibernica]|uniref:DUF262 domain-containing protein n=1 Tax=Yersinia hibernica TaxID=2339259 RepID=A0ABX5R0A0_9GAMM|nr:DUF262 domain-containing protein [Yersinia hibernica]QAX78908.1 DUF262 domain-containing protein [Yersinia hibernica]
MDIIKIQDQIDRNRKTVSFDSYDITIKQVYDMLAEGIIDISPEYQRHFIWDETRQSQLIESIFLGIPVPSLYMATNRDSSWDVVDGVQRLSTIINFIGSETEPALEGHYNQLTLEGLEKLDSMNGLTFDRMPKQLQIMFLTRSIKLTVLNDRSDFSVRYDLFERLNTGGVILHPQEIRNCVYTGEFNDFIKKCAENVNFKAVVKLTENAKKTGNLEELVLKFFAYYENSIEFTHSVKGFLNDYMENKTTSFKNKKNLESIFTETFEFLNDSLPNGIVRGNRVNITPIVLYEAISVGTAMALKIKNKNDLSKETLIELLNSSELKKYTTGATNSRKALTARNEIVKSELIK